MKNNTHWLLALGAALALSACTTKNQSSYIEIGSLVPPTGSTNMDGGSPLGCAYEASTAPYTQQVFNTNRDFSVGIVVTNNLPDNSDLALGRLNTNGFLVSQVVTTYESTDGTAITAPEQITPAQGLVPTGTTVAIGGTIIPQSVAIDLATVTTVRLHVRVEGRLLDGSTASSNEFLAVGVPTAADLDSSSCVVPQ